MLQRFAPRAAIWEVASAFVERVARLRKTILTKIINKMQQANYSRANCESGMQEAEGAPGLLQQAQNQHPGSERSESPLLEQLQKDASCISSL